jgi:GTPase
VKPLVAIVGRPNVGKSTLFNRIIRQRRAIVEDSPGVTRDRHYADSEWNGRTFTVIDTGGFVPGETDALLSQVREQAQLAVEECQVIILVTDGREGLTSADQEVATYLRKSGKPVVLAANKMDSHKVSLDSLQGEMYRLGLGEVFAISAEHSRGVDDLFDRVVELLPPGPAYEEEVAQAEREGDEQADGEEAEAKEKDEEDDIIRLAIVGRPNVGKSTLINALLKTKRLVASDVPGTTRDPIDLQLTYRDRDYILTDTAGIRRKKAISHRVEHFAVIAALKAIERSDVAVLVIDATEPGVDQDSKIAGIADEKGRALLIVVNKWDKVTEKSKQDAVREELKRLLKFVSYAPILFTSSLTGDKVEKVLDFSAQLFDQYHFRAPTPQLNKLLEHIMEFHPVPFEGGKPLRIYYIAQVSAAPPTFALTCNRPKQIPDRYKRYIVNQLRDTFDLKVPITLLWRERPGKAKREARKLTFLKKKKKSREKRRG